MDGSTQKHGKVPNPKDTANIFSSFSFFYLHELFRKGYKKELDDVDIYEVTQNCRSKESGNQIEAEWKKLCKNYQRPSLYRLLWACYGRKYIALGILQLVVKTTTILLTLLAIERIVKHFKITGKDHQRSHVALYAGLLVLVKLFTGFYSNNYRLALIELGMKMRTALCSLIYRKSLKLSASALVEFNTGKIVTLMTKDVYYVDVAVLFLNEIWISLFHLIFMTYLIYSKIGFHAFTGIGFILFTIVVEVFIGKITAFMRMKNCKKTDLRLHITTELLSAIRLIKIYTWGNYFCEKISAIRKREIKNLRKVFYLNAITTCLGVMSTKIAFYLLFVFYIHSTSFVPAEIIYFTKTCFKNLTMIIMSVPFGIVQTASLYSAEKRITQFLHSEELPTKLQIKKDSNPELSLQSVSVKMGKKYILKNITIPFTRGLNLITGATASGKSSLLKVILREFSKIEGKVDVSGSISYASEEPWLFPGTIKQNILFGQPFDGSRYQKILEICCLKLDLERFDSSDLTLVGDHGINLSRGQQSRINLARAIYKLSDVYLMDDCLFSLDDQVQEHIFSNCIKEFLYDKICVLVSNNEKFIRYADRLVVMENGTSKLITKPLTTLEYRVSKYIDDVEERKIIVNNNDNNNSTIGALPDYFGGEKSKLLPDNYLEIDDVNIYYEKNKTGNVKKVIYKKYFQFGGNLLVRGFLILLFFIDQGTVSYNDKLVSQWVNDEQVILKYNMKNETNTTKYNQAVEDRDGIFVLYSIMIVTSIVLILFRSFLHFFLSTRISYTIHRDMMRQVVSATMDFFDCNFIGNILNRFSKDLHTIDEKVPFVLYECFRMTSIIVCTSILIAYVKYILLIPLIILFLFMFILRKYYLPTGRSLKRLECATKSPVVGHLNASMEGLATIRAHGKEGIVQEEFDRHQDLYTSAYHMTQMTSRAFGLVVDILCSFFIAAILVQSLLKKSGTLAGDIGLVILQAITLTTYLEQIIQHWADLEYQMTSVERSVEYTEIKTENQKGKVLEDWPRLGTIEYKDVSLIYKNSGGPVLKHLNFKIHPKEKIGVVGRTGAGKSSLVAALFRLYDTEGRILIDDVNIQTVSLEVLRTKITIVPQNPLLFAGTIRSNIDPYHQHNDEEIWKAIEVIGLKHVVKDITNVITDGGSHFSAGQKQLLCLVRALIEKSKIIILDEATGSVDTEISDKIHKVLQEKFFSCTVLTIAHRLKAVRNCDKIMLIDEGRIIEFDTQTNLLKDANSRYRAMLEGPPQ